MKDWPQKTCLVTGGAGFIGSHLVDRLLSLGARVIIIDNFDPYYTPQQKEKNLQQALKNKQCLLIRGDIKTNSVLGDVFSKNRFDHVFHLAAKAGVRKSLTKPDQYYQTNLIGTLKILENIKDSPTTQFIFGGSSSVYGENNIPFTETQATDVQISPYASSKKAAELLTRTYAHLYKIPTTILRFFTVYGPRCRPDMAPYKFIDAILSHRTLTKFGSGNSSRDYTYIDDIIDGLIAAAENPFTFEVINLGGSQSISLNQFIDLIENTTRTKAKIEIKPIPNGDVKKTLANINKAKKMLNWQPKIDLKKGIERTVAWMKN